MWTTEEIIALSVIVFLITLWIWHEIIKSAVYAAIVKAMNDSKPALSRGELKINDNFWSTEQIELQRKFENGEITLEEYKRDFNK